MTSRHFRGQPRYVLRPVTPRTEKIREHHNQAGTTSDTAVERRGQIGLGQFHVGWFDNGQLRAFGEQFGHLLEEPIARLALRSVIDNHDSQGRIGRSHEVLE